MPAHDVVVHASYTTGIGGIRYYDNSTQIYTLDGKKVKRMQRGVCIINGKKVIVR